MLSRRWPAGLTLLLTAPFLLWPTFAPALTALALLLILAGWWRTGWRSGAIWPASPFNPLLLIWSLAVLMGLLVSEDPDLSLPRALGLFLGLAIWRELVLTIRNRGRLQWAVLLFVLLGLAMILLGAVSTDWLREIPFFQRWPLPFPPQLLRPVTAVGAGGDGRAIIGVHMNELGGVLAFFLPLLAALWLAARGSAARLGGAGVVALLAWLLFLSQSRGAWLGAAAGAGLGLALWGWSQPPGSRWRRLPAGLLLVGLLLAGLTVLVGSDTIARTWRELPPETAVGSFSTLEFRREVWHWALTAIGEEPLTGVGLGAFRRVILRRYETALDPTFDIAHAHNLYLQLALDVGLPGLLAYLALLVLAFAAGWGAARRDVRLRPLVIGLLAGLTALHVFGLLDALAPGAKPAWIFWYALGLLAALERLRLA